MRERSRNSIGRGLRIGRRVVLVDVLRVPRFFLRRLIGPVVLNRTVQLPPLGPCPTWVRPRCGVFVSCRRVSDCNESSAWTAPPSPLSRARDATIRLPASRHQRCPRKATGAVNWSDLPHPSFSGCAAVDFSPMSGATSLSSLLAPQGLVHRASGSRHRSSNRRRRRPRRSRRGGGRGDEIATGFEAQRDGGGDAAAGSSASAHGS